MKDDCYSNFCRRDTFIVRNRQIKAAKTSLSSFVTSIAYYENQLIVKPL